jgi:hypothetical protein
MGFKADLPAVDLGWATVYLYGDRIVVTANVKTTKLTEDVTTVTSTHRGAWVEVKKS